MFKMCKLLLKIMYKGKLFKHVFNHDGIKRNRTISIILSTKGNPQDAHFICHLDNGHMLIPETSRLPKETAKIYLKLNGKEFEQYKHTSFIIPIHAIGTYDNDIDTDATFDYTITI